MVAGAARRCFRLIGLRCTKTSTPLIQRIFGQSDLHNRPFANQSARPCGASHTHRSRRADNNPGETMTSRSSRTLLARLLAALLAFTMIAAACGGDDDGDAGTDAGGSDSSAADDSADADADDGGDAVVPTITEPAEEVLA